MIIDWNAVADYLSDQPSANLGDEDCPWCALVGNAGGGPTDEERRKIVCTNWNLLSGTMWANELAEFLSAGGSG